jgi:ABC-2 type transport system permease protein
MECRFLHHRCVEIQSTLCIKTFVTLCILRGEKMIRILDIAFKDLLQLSRDFKTFMFLLLMPILFTFLFGYAFGGFGGGDSDSRLPVGYLSEDDHWVTDSLHDLLDTSEVIRLDENVFRSASDLEKIVADGDLAAAIIVPDGYGRALLKDKTARLIVIADTGSSAWTTVEAELLSRTSRLDSAVRTATIIEQVDSERMPFKYAFEQSLSAWDEPPIAIQETTSEAVKKAGGQSNALAHTAPGMMLQFAIAGLLTAAQVIVTERKSRTLERLLTTATRRVHIVMGHFLAIFLLIFTQFTILITFGQFILKVDYLRVPLATMLVAFSAALCISALGLLIGVFARSEEQAITFSLIPMFVFSGLGGAWVPLEVTGETFRAIGHVSPVAWAMDGFENIVARGLGFESVWMPALMLMAYGLGFFLLAVWRFRRMEA